MAQLAVLALLLIGAIVVTAAPAEDDKPKYKPLILPREGYEAEQKEAERKQAEHNETDDHIRYRRVTCDLLSYGGKIGDAACAANCLSMGKAGGRCNDGVCQCRKTSFSDLWNDRFGK